MGPDTRRIEDEIRAERVELDRNLHTLESKARELADWRTHYRRHTGAALALAFGVGILLGGKGRTNGHGGVRRHATLVAPTERSDSSLSSRTARVGFNALRMIGDNPRARYQVSETWQNVLETLVAMATGKAVRWLGSLVPGFSDEYEARQPASPVRSTTH